MGERKGELVTEVRGEGLLWGVELVSPGVVDQVMVALAKRGLLVSPCVSDPSTLRLLPPLVTTSDELDEALAILRDALDATSVP
jgi:putrescine aminotransferase